MNTEKLMKRSVIDLACDNAVTIAQSLDQE